MKDVNRLLRLVAIVAIVRVCVCVCDRERQKGLPVVGRNWIRGRAECSNRAESL